MDEGIEDSSFDAQEKGQEAYDENGVDLTLIRWMLSLSLEERLQVLQDNVNTIQMMRDELIITPSRQQIA
jgi:hypothetical protein